MEDTNIRTNDDLVAASDHLHLPEDPGVKGLIDNWERWDIVNRGQMHSHLPPSYVLLRKIDENEELTVSTEQSTRYESDPWVSDWSVGSTEIMLTGDTPFEKIQLPEKRRRVSPSLGLRALSISTRSTASDSSSQEGSETTENATMMIPDYDVVLGYTHTPTLGTKLWRLVRQQYAKTFVSDQQLEQLKTELNQRLEASMDDTTSLPRAPIFWYSAYREDKLIPDRSERRILKNGNKFGMASNEAIKQDIKSAPKQSRTRQMFNLSGSLEEVLQQARETCELWAGTDKTKRECAKGFKEDLGRLNPWRSEYEKKRADARGRARTDPKARQAHLREAHIHDIHHRQLEAPFIALVNQLGNAMVERHRLSLENPVDSALKKDPSTGGSGGAGGSGSSGGGRNGDFSEQNPKGDPRGGFGGPGSCFGPPSNPGPSGGPSAHGSGKTRPSLPRDGGSSASDLEDNGDGSDSVSTLTNATNSTAKLIERLQLNESETDKQINTKQAPRPRASRQDSSQRVSPSSMLVTDTKKLSPSASPEDYIHTGSDNIHHDFAQQRFARSLGRAHLNTRRARENAQTEDPEEVEDSSSPNPNQIRDDSSGHRSGYVAVRASFQERVFQTSTCSSMFYLHR